MRKSVRLGAGLVLAMGLLAQGPVQAKKKADVSVDPNAPRLISAKDKKLGAESHEGLLNEFGGLYKVPQATYVTKVGQRVAVQSGLSSAANDFTISLLNSPVNNAFAVPGGYVYVTRQLMVLMNNEAELASVLGHEVGHVDANHSRKRSKRATFGNIATVLGTIGGAVLGGAQGAQLGQQIFGTAAQGLVLKYSRDQEYQADDLGISYLLKAGYDTMAASTMLASLAAQTTLDMKRSGKSDKALPEWASTHPDPAQRVVRAQQKAKAVGGTGRETNADAFIAQLDGMLYDDDPAQGVVDGQTFRHPDLRLFFTAPDGYSINNGSSAVTMSGQSGQAKVDSAGSYSGDMNTYVAAAFKSVGGQTPLNYGSVSRTTINGLPVGYATATATTQSGQQVRVTVYAYEFAANQAYAVTTLTPTSVSDPFGSLYNSVRKLSDSEASAVRPRRVDIVTVKSGDTLESLAAKMAYSDYRVERFRVLNGLLSGETLKTGQKVKIIIAG